ncbi:MAG: right-handed parallel beta-helix repeat-containing protein [Anaerolineales bacterium]|nr:right-handed parallel beta-helix repeat-containing protein [Anaerolineales bacterium]
MKNIFQKRTPKAVSTLQWITLALILAMLACNLPGDGGEEEAEAPPSESDETIPAETEAQPPTEDSQPQTEIIPTGTLGPEDLEYLGAFRLPDTEEGMWDYSGHALTYYPQGDSDGIADGFPGSLFSAGHDQSLYVSEISIPTPIDSRNLDDLNTATTLQPFADISGGIFDTEAMDVPRLGLEYLPAQGDQDSDKLHFVFGQHFQEFDPAFGWSELDLSNPEAAGAWVFNGYTNYATSDYLLEIPAAWADSYTPGMYLAAGRFREGVWSGGGPALFAYAPWSEGNPPAPNATLTYITPLLLYGTQLPDGLEIAFDETSQMNGYQESDHWWGAAWLTAGDNAAVVFAGTKALGDSWYGFSNGVIWDYDCAEQDPPTCPDVPEWPNDNRGYWAEDYQGQLIFFDPNDLAAVALGQMETYEPQPYATLDLTPYLYAPELNHGEYKRDLIGAIAFDRANGLLYVIERLADEYKSVIHVFQVTASPASSAIPPEDSTAETDTTSETTTTEGKSCPPLPFSDRPSVSVASEAELRDQAQNAAPGTTILVEPGTYNMQDFVYIVNAGISLRGASGARDDVILDFGGMQDGYFGVMVEADDVTIADLTIRNAVDHGVAVQGSDRPVLYNLHIVDIGDQLVKVNPVGDGSDDGLLACSHLEYTTAAPDDYTNGISAHDAHNWIVRDNRWERIRTPSNDPVPTILFWNGSTDTIVERNVLIDCYQGIAFGNAGGDVGDHSGGIVRNNFIYASMPHDVVIEMVHATDWLVAHNTVLLMNPVDGLTWGMEARFSDTSGTFANNLTNLDIYTDRDDAQGTSSSDVTNAHLNWFIDPANGDLHLTTRAAAAIDQAAPLAEVTTDIDGDSRPRSNADVGADEVGE